ncbi:MAG: Sec-independent protein translocase protein TatB [Alphaproteobacteria bacterium]
MFDIGWTELAIVALIALLVIGPKDLPQAMRTVSGWVKRIRGMAREFQSSIDEMVHEAELDGVKEEIGSIAGKDLDAMVENTIDPDGTFANEFDLGDEFEPPEETIPAPRKKKTAKAGVKSKRAKAAPGAKKPAAKKKTAAKKPSPKRPAAKKAPPPASSTRPPTKGLAANPAANKTRS